MRKKSLRSLLLAGVLTAVMLVTCLGTVPVSAKTYPEKDPGWYVTYTTLGTWNSNITSGRIAHTLSLMEPGDEVIYKITVKNENAKTTYWYLQNKVIESLEDGAAAAGGAYTYRLSYTDNKTKKETVYVDSSSIGGEADSPAGVGLHQATYGIEEEWLYMDALASGESGVVTLQIKLDGETFGSEYMGVGGESAEPTLSLQFAVELEASAVPGGGGGGGYWGVGSAKTGDDTPIALYLTLAAAGVAILLALIFGLKRRRRADEETDTEETERDDAGRKGGSR